MKNILKSTFLFVFLLFMSTEKSYTMWPASALILNGSAHYYMNNHCHSSYKSEHGSVQEGISEIALQFSSLAGLFTIVTHGLVLHKMNEINMTITSDKDRLQFLKQRLEILNGINVGYKISAGLALVSLGVLSSYRRQKKHFVNSQSKRN